MRLIFLFFLSCFLVSNVNAQQSDKISKDYYFKFYGIKSINENQPSNDFRLMKKHDNILNIPFNALLLFYNRVLSDQISANCDFSPSCSRFSYQAIRELGLIKGIFLTADRLTRCNGSANSDAPYFLMDTKNAKVNDSPSLYRLAR